MEKITKLIGGRVALNANHSERIDLAIHRGRLLPLGDSVADSPQTTRYDLSGHLILPGLVNAHDHLEFNLFPRLGRGPWENASQWAADIYRPHASPVKEHLRIPKRIRLIWGGIKNLLSGVTTVAHHNSWEPSTFTGMFPVRVVRRYGWAHSIEFSPDLADRCRATPLRWPFIIHAAEGTGQNERAEVTRLDEMGVLSRRTLLVHAVAAGPAELNVLRRRGTSIVWCPSSNLFTLGRTLSPNAFQSGVVFALGTDSAITGEGDLIDEMRIARTVAGQTAQDVYPLVTTHAAKALRLTAGQGTIRERGVADLVVVKDTGQTPAEALSDLRPELVLIGGRIMLASQGFAELAGGDFHLVGVEGRGCLLVRADIPRLRAAAAESLGTDIRLAGKRLCA
jgi:cytosine/adenosine deaminase-related metal-dependent hydrolase